MSSPAKTKSKSSSRTNGRPTASSGNDRPDVERFLGELAEIYPGSWPSQARRIASSGRPAVLPKPMNGSEEHPLTWAISLPKDSPVFALLRLKRHPKAGDEDKKDWDRIAQRWMRSQLDQARSPLEGAVECLAWAHMLPRLSTRMAQDVWQELFAFLSAVIRRYADSPADDASPEESVIHQLLGGELPLTLAYRFPDSSACQSLAGPARTVVSQGLIDLLDGEGLPHARFNPYWRALLACWTRFVVLDPQVRGGRISKSARLQFEWLVRQTIRWRRADGRLIWEDPSQARVAVDEQLKAALRVAGDDVDRELWSCSIGRQKPERSRYDLPHAGEHSEWGEQAVLRTSWSPDAAYLAATFHGGRLQTELGSGDVRFWAGADEPLIQINDEMVTGEGEWTELCWDSDQDADYLELERDLSNGWKLQRQILLVRDDLVLLTADVVLGEHPAKIDYRRALPLAETVRLSPESDTVEARLHRRGQSGCMMPLALSEWREQTHRGTFADGELRQSAFGSGLYAPLWIDLDPQRKRWPRTWRQLTVALDREILPPDVAVAYRVQIGCSQWIVYRSLAPPAARTFLGQHVTSEFLVGRFTTEGVVENLVEVEPE